MLARGPAEVRAQVRAWLEALLAAEGCAAGASRSRDGIS